MLKPLADKRHALERFRGKLSGISSQNRAEQLLAAAEERLDDWVSKQLEPLQESMAEAINGLAQQQRLIETLVRRDAVAAVVREADAQQDNEPEKVDLDTALDSMLDECYLTADFVKKVEQDFKGLRIERVESLGMSLQTCTCRLYLPMCFLPALSLSEQPRFQETAPAPRRFRQCIPDSGSPDSCSSRIQRRSPDCGSSRTH